MGCSRCSEEFVARCSMGLVADKAAAKSSGRGKTNCVGELNGLFNAKPSLVVRTAQTRARYSTPDSRFVKRYDVNSP